MAADVPDLPDIATADAFARWRADPGRWLPAVRGIARAAGVAADAPSRFGTGTNLVVDLDGRTVLKLFPPVYRRQFVSERAALGQLSGRLSVPVPAVLAQGQESGWSWLVTTRLGGVNGAEAWPAMPEPDRLRILEAIGRTIAEVQAVPLGEVAAIEPRWPDFVARQAAGCVARHRRLGLPDRLLRDLPALLAGVPAVVPLKADPVILTGEWIPENLLLCEERGGWRLAAVIDFGDVMAGWREYDLLGPSAFMCGGRHDRVGALLRGYGMAPRDCDPAMRRRLLTLMLLHRASDLRNVDIPDWEGRVGSLFDLEDVVWPPSDGRGGRGPGRRVG